MNSIPRTTPDVFKVWELVKELFIPPTKKKSNKINYFFSFSHSTNHSLYHIKLVILFVKNNSLSPLSWGKLRKKPATSRFDESFVPLATSEKRFARHHFCGPPSEFPLTSSWAAKVHQLSGPTRKTIIKKQWFIHVSKRVHLLKVLHEQRH